jgi:hypothetical protein
MLGEEVPAAAKIDEPYFWSVADDDLAIGSLESRAGDDPRLLLGALSKPDLSVRETSRVQP